jgi:hypothetical protein
LKIIKIIIIINRKHSNGRLRTRQLVQIRKEFWKKKLKVNADCVKNMKTIDHLTPRCPTLANLSIKIQRTRNMICFVTLVITGAKGIVSKSLRNTWKQYQDNIQ